MFLLFQDNTKINVSQETFDHLLKFDECLSGYELYGYKSSFIPINYTTSSKYFLPYIKYLETGRYNIDTVLQVIILAQNLIDNFILGKLWHHLLQESIEYYMEHDYYYPVYYLINNDLDNKSDYGKYIYIVCENNSVECLKLLIKKYSLNIDLINEFALNNDKNTILTESVKFESTECVEVLLINSIDPNTPNKYSYTPLMYTYKNKKDTCMKYLLKYGADPEMKCDHGSTPLGWMASTNNAKCTKMLLDHGVNINAQDKDGYTALITASYWGSLECVKILLEYGADVHINKDNCTALLWSSKVKIMELLLEYGSDINDRTRTGKTILMSMCYPKNNFECVDYLLKHGADVNIIDKWGKTPLMKACQGGSVECVELILKYKPFTDFINKLSNFITIVWSSVHHKRFSVNI